MNKKYDDPVRVSLTMERLNHEFLQRRAAAEGRSLIDMLNRMITKIRTESEPAPVNPLDLLAP